MVFPQLSLLSWDWFRTVLVYSLYGAVAGAIFPHHHRAGGVRRPGVEGRHGGRRGGSGATGIMTAWRRSLVTIAATGLATLKVARGK